MKVHSDIQGLAFPAMKAMMLHEAHEHGLPVLKDTVTRLMVKSDYGAFGIDAKDNGLRLSVEAEHEADLFVLRDSLVAHIAHFLPDVAATIKWSDAVQSGQLPPNFQFGELISSERLCADFQRLVLRLSDPDRFDDRSIHFRFVLPKPDDDDPQWPFVSQNGATVWPDGEKALHRPVYTVRHLHENEITVDIFRHDGGRTTEWADKVAPGTRVGIVGPGGGGVLEETEVLLAGDETAYPAISRIIDALPKGSTGNVLLLDHGDKADYPIPTHEGLTLRWIAPQDFDDAVVGSLPNAENGYAWIAAEKARIKIYRAHEAISAFAKDQRYLASYWSA
ncbi:MAG: siderophore-interacting protein [Marinovum sp.]|nr:siderophore-interacting protein [Marinovum sp.]